ncbi:hypothetical protein [Blastococcus mobilis]|nr:hypothetical protein [Blastococcus mobilis]
MDIPVTAAPWLVLGVVLGTLLLLAALGVLALRRGRARPEEPPAAAPSSSGLGQDDLPAFLEFPPGSVRAPAVPADGWAALSSPAAPPPAHDSPREPSGSTRVLMAMAVTALLLVGAAAAVATARIPGADDPGDRDGTRAPVRTTEAPDPATVSARLTFGGVVLQRHPVGVTVAYPRVRATVAGNRAAAEVELATFNCLSGEAPENPVAAGCTRSVTEHGELTTPDLEVVTDGTELRFSGRFTTFRRPNGTPAVATGRVYELMVRAAPRDGRAGVGPEPATGLFQVGDDRVGTTADEPNTITYGG